MVFSTCRCAAQYVAQHVLVRGSARASARLSTCWCVAQPNTARVSFRAITIPLAATSTTCKAANLKHAEEVNKYQYSESPYVKVYCKCIGFIKDLNTVLFCIIMYRNFFFFFNFALVASTSLSKGYMYFMLGHLLTYPSICHRYCECQRSHNK